MKKEKIFGGYDMNPSYSRAWLIKDSIFHPIASYIEGHNLESKNYDKRQETLEFGIRRTGNSKIFVYQLSISGQYPLKGKTLKGAETQLKNFTRKAKGLKGFYKDSEFDFRNQELNILASLDTSNQNKGPNLYVRQIERVPDLEIVLNKFVPNCVSVFNKLSIGAKISDETMKRVIETAREQDKYPLK